MNMICEAFANGLCKSANCKEAKPHKSNKACFTLTDCGKGRYVCVPIDKQHEVKLNEKTDKEFNKSKKKEK